MKTLYDVQQLLKQFGVYVYVGKRVYDIELMALELDNLFKAGVVEQDLYTRAKLVLRHEHHVEDQHASQNHLAGGKTNES
ncbi:YqgQ family protein [Paucilactobacillus sp. N302-9]